MSSVSTSPARPTAPAWSVGTRSGADSGRGRIPLALRRFRDPALALLLFAVALWRFVGLAGSAEFHRDEARWIHRASYLQALTDPLGPLWVEEGRYPGTSLDERFPLRGQPPLGGYLMGLGLLVQGRDLSVNGFWNMDQDDAWNAAHGNMPDPADLHAGRRANAAAAAAAVAVLFLLALRLTNLVGAMVAALFLLFHPLLGHHAALAGSDTLLVLLLALAALTAFSLGERPTWPRALLLGVLLGLGGATKLTPLLLAPPLAAFGLALLLVSVARRRRRADRRPADRLPWHLLSLPVVAFAVFVAVYPYLWRDPIDHTRNLFDFRALGMDLQGMAWPNAAVETRTEALQRVGIKLGTDWSTAGWLAGELAERTGIDWRDQVRGVDLAVAIVGAELLLVAVVRRGLRSGTALVAAILAGEVALIVLGMRADFARYHLPIVLMVALCVGLVFGAVWDVGRRFASSLGDKARRYWTAPAGATPDTRGEVDAPVFG